MSGRGNGRGGRGNNARGGRGRGRGQSYTAAASTAKRGLCTTLGTNVFDYGQKSSADQLRTSWEKLVQYVGTNYGQDVSNELQNKITVILPEPTYTAAIMTRHAAREAMIRRGQRNLQTARRAQEFVLQAAVEAAVDPTAPMQLAMLQNAIAEADFAAAEEVPVELTDSEKTLNSNEWRTYRERSANLAKNRGQAFSLILGQCTQLLQDKMKQDTDWDVVSTSYDPLLLYRLIERTILAQTEDQYPFATVYEQESHYVPSDTSTHSDVRMTTTSMSRSIVIRSHSWSYISCWTVLHEAQSSTNVPAILLEKNGKSSSGKRTKHINIRYFFVTDRVQKGEVSVVWCPTGDMIGDYATKPLQGTLFRKVQRPNYGSGTGSRSGARKSARSGAKGKAKRYGPACSSAAPQECVGSRRSYKECTVE